MACQWEEEIDEESLTRDERLELWRLAQRKLLGSAGFAYWLVCHGYYVLVPQKWRHWSDERQDWWEETVVLHRGSTERIPKSAFEGLRKELAKS